jgi:hypothetical protein
LKFKEKIKKPTKAPTLKGGVDAMSIVRLLIQQATNTIPEAVS